MKDDTGDRGSSPAKGAVDDVIFPAKGTVDDVIMVDVVDDVTPQPPHHGLACSLSCIAACMHWSCMACKAGWPWCSMAESMASIESSGRKEEPPRDPPRAWLLSKGSCKAPQEPSN